MKQSIVNIQSNQNDSFGTGFVIYRDKEKGNYILTCNHVLEKVEKPIIEGEIAKVVVKNEFIDLLVLYVKGLNLPALPLALTPCEDEDVEIIGFSHFTQENNQKLHIKARLYEKNIQIHSRSNNEYFNVKKIEAKEGFHFDQGNSGSPVLCKETGNVIAVISKKDRNNIAYAIDIVHLKSLWQDAPQEIFTPNKKKKRSIIYYIVLIPTLIALLYFTMSFLLLGLVKLIQVIA